MGSLDDLLLKARRDSLGRPPCSSELKDKALINPVARAAELDPDFSKRIRERGRPGFGKP